VWVLKSLKPVRLSPVQCSDSGHAVAHDCWSPDVALRASGSNNSHLSSFSLTCCCYYVRDKSDPQVEIHKFFSARWTVIEKTHQLPKRAQAAGARRAFALRENARQATGIRFAMNETGINWIFYVGQLKTDLICKLFFPQIFVLSSCFGELFSIGDLTRICRLCFYFRLDQIHSLNHHSG